ncbi:MAG: prepilin-type N-terminal cleavage/methylation domain-containing protein [Syntrophaceae bacterium]
MHQKNKASKTEGNYGKRFHDSCGGFTLLELLISIVLLTLIVIITMGAMKIGSRSVVAGEIRMDTQERFRTVFQIIDAQIQSMSPLTYDKDGNKKYYFKGDKKTLRLSTNYSIWTGERGYVIVDYRVENDGSGKDILTASERIPGFEGHSDVRLIDASGITFEYFQKDTADDKGTWRDTLDEGTSLPDEIRVNILSGSQKLSMLFPVRLKGEMVFVSGGASTTSAAH